MTLAVRLWLSVMLAVVGAYGAYSFWRHAHAMNVSQGTGATDSESASTDTPSRPLSDFTFTEKSGESLNLGALEGDVWVASFFFASCPGFCAQMNQIISTLQPELKERGVKIVSVTVDPDTDTPEVLRKYAEHYKADPKEWLFLTGPLTETKELGQDVFHVTVMGKEHSDRIILVDRKGKVRGTWRSREPLELESFRRTLDKVLKEQPASAKPQAVESPS